MNNTENEKPGSLERVDMRHDGNLRAQMDRNTETLLRLGAARPDGAELGAVHRLDMLAAEWRGMAMRERERGERDTDRTNKEACRRVADAYELCADWMCGGVGSGHIGEVSH